MPTSSIEVCTDLSCDGRQSLAGGDFLDDEKLYRGFSADELVDGKLPVEAMRFPDMSCNWSRFACPCDVRLRLKGGRPVNDGCFSFTISDARFGNYVVVVHDPMCGGQTSENHVGENYSHCEVRELREDDSEGFVPPRNRKIKGKQRRLEWRVNLKEKLAIELLPIVGD